MKFISLLCSIIFSYQANAIINNIDHVESRLLDFTYLDLCTTMKAKNTMLISPIGFSEIECFNQKFKVSEFCLKKLPEDASFTRGFINTTEKKIYCETAKAVSLSIFCEYKKCRNHKSACEKLKNAYAMKLELSHSSLVEDKLNCYYSKDTTEDLDEK